MPKKNNGKKALFLACTNGHIDVVKQLLKIRGINVNAIDDNRETALHWACSKGHTEVVKELLKVREIDINATDKYEETPLHLACTKGHIDVVKELLKVAEINVNAANKMGQTALHWAYDKDPRIVKQLLKVPGINVNVADRLTQSTPLHWACHRAPTDVVKLLLKAPEIDVNVTNKHKETAFFLACAHGYTDVVKLFLKAPGIDIITGDYGVTPLHETCARGHTNTAKELIKYIVLKNSNEEKPHFILKNEVLLGYWNECRTELLSLKEVTADKSSLVDFCTIKNRDKLAAMARKHKLRDTTDNVNFTDESPIFGNVINEAFQEGLARSEITDQLIENPCLHNNVFSSKKNVQPSTRNKIIKNFIRKKVPVKKVQLNEDTEREIFSYLDNSDLESLNEAISNPPINEPLMQLTLFQKLKIRSNTKPENTSPAHSLFKF